MAKFKRSIRNGFVIFTQCLFTRINIHICICFNNTIVTGTGAFYRELDIIKLAHNTPRNPQAERGGGFLDYTGCCHLISLAQIFCFETTILPSGTQKRLDGLHSEIMIMYTVSDKFVLQKN